MVAAVNTIQSVNEVEDFLNDFESPEYSAIKDPGEYEGAGSYRGAAGWLVFVSSAAILFHIVMSIVRMIYIISAVKKHFRLFAFSVSG